MRIQGCAAGVFALRAARLQWNWKVPCGCGVVFLATVPKTSRRSAGAARATTPRPTVCSHVPTPPNYTTFRPSRAALQRFLASLEATVKEVGRAEQRGTDDDASDDEASLFLLGEAPSPLSTFGERDDEFATSSASHPPEQPAGQSSEPTPDSKCTGAF